MQKFVVAGGLIVIGVCLGAVIWFGLTTRPASASQEQAKRPLLSKLPPIKNCTEHIKLIAAELASQGEAQVAELELENIAYVPVISISVDQIANKTMNSIITSGFSPDKPPEVIIAPGERKTVRLGNLASTPIRIGAAMFSDGTEEGCKQSVKTIRELKNHDTKPGPQK